MNMDDPDYLVASYDTLNLAKRWINSFNVPTPQGTATSCANPCGFACPGQPPPRFLLKITRPLYIGTSTDEPDYLVASYDTLTKRWIDSFNVPTPQGKIWLVSTKYPTV